MEGELYRALYLVAYALGQSLRSPRVWHLDWQIAVTYFWAVLHDRPILWACQEFNWPREARRKRLPSPATMSRRLRRTELIHFLQAMEQRLKDRLGGQEGPTPVRYLDGKPLPVGGLSGDQEATNGYGAGKIAKGYKLHAICDPRGVPLVWEIKTLRKDEPGIGEVLVERLGPGSGYLVADGNYDKNRLYDRAGRYGWQLVTRMRQGANLGHRRHSPYRIQASQLGPRKRRKLLRRRSTIDRMFGNLCSGSAGLAPLPSWVRTLHRVKLWVQAKIILFCLRTWLRQKAA